MKFFKKNLFIIALAVLVISSFSFGAIASAVEADLSVSITNTYFSGSVTDMGIPYATATAKSTNPQYVLHMVGITITGNGSSISNYNIGSAYNVSVSTTLSPCYGSPVYTASVSKQ